MIDADAAPLLVVDPAIDKFVNLKTGKALDLEIPTTLLARARR